MVSFKVYVEGGGNSKVLRSTCRRGFRSFIEKAGLTGGMPRIIACGNRENAYRMFNTAIAQRDEKALLLVDAEGAVSGVGVWQHLKDSDGWEQPKPAIDLQCHLMVQVMESWFLADRQALQHYYGQGYRSEALPPEQAIEQIPKREVLKGLQQASIHTKKGRYSKSEHSFEILAKLDPHKVRTNSFHADRLLRVLQS